MFWPESQNAVVSRKQNLVKQRQQNDLLAYSVEDLRDRIPAIALINPFATRIVNMFYFYFILSCYFKNNISFSFLGHFVQRWSWKSWS